MRIADAVREAHDRFPGCSLTEEEFLDDLGDLDLIEIADLEGMYLRCAALRGDPVATLAISAKVGAAATRVLSATSPERADEIAQRICVRLLRPLDGSEAKLAQFRGRASLSAWLRVIAAREVIHALRGPEHGRRAELNLDTMRAPQSSAPHSIDHANYAQVFKTSFQQAFEALSIHDRTLLRQHHRDGIPISKLAVVRNVHRGTLARELAQIRTRLQNAVESELRLTMQLSPNEQAELHGELASQLDASLSRLFREVPG